MTPILLFAILFGILILPRIIISVITRRSIHSLRTCPPARVAVVFGAGLEKTGLPTRVLRERIETAVSLLRMDKVQTIVMSGGNLSVYRNETEAMRRYALALGVRPEQIQIDPDGFRSINSCINLTKLNTRQIILVTQAFHLPRVVWSARALGTDVIGCTAFHRVEYWDDFIWWHIREFLACARAVFDVVRERSRRKP